MSAPIGAVHLGKGRVVVAGLDVPAKGLRVRVFDAGRPAPLDAAADPMLFAGELTWSSDAEVSGYAAPSGSSGAVFVWSGSAGGKRVRRAVRLDAAAAPSGAPFEVMSATCASADGMHWSDGRAITGRAWSGAPLTPHTLAEEKEASIFCSTRAAFALVDDEDGVSVMRLDGDAGAPVPLWRDAELAKDELRERGEFVVDQDFGLVRLGASGALVLREVRAGALGPLRKLSTTLSKDEEIVAVDAAASHVVLVARTDVSARCPPGDAGRSSAKLRVLRVDRASFEERTFDVAPTECGAELGPFFTGVTRAGVSVAWAERGPTAGGAAPITGLSWITVDARGELSGPVRRALEADALADAGCDPDGCWAGALLRRPGTDVMVAGYALAIPWGSSAQP